MKQMVTGPLGTGDPCQQEAQAHKGIRCACLSSMFPDQVESRAMLAGYAKAKLVELQAAHGSLRHYLQDRSTSVA